MGIFDSTKKTENTVNNQYNSEQSSDNRVAEEGASIGGNISLDGGLNTTVNATQTDYGAISASFESMSKVTQESLDFATDSMNESLAVNQKVSLSAIESANESMNIYGDIYETSSDLVGDIFDGAVGAISKTADNASSAISGATNSALSFANDSTRSDSSLALNDMMENFSKIALYAGIAFGFYSYFKGAK